MDYILNEKKITHEEIINNDTEKTVQILTKLYKNDITIFKIELLQQLHILEIELLACNDNDYPNISDYITQKNNEINKINNMINLIENNKYNDIIDNSNLFNWIIEWYKYEVNTNIFLEKNKKLINSTKQEFVLWSNEDNELHYTTYIFKINDETRNILLKNFKNIYDWVFPNSLENLSFYKEGISWLISISHEQICEIKINNLKEKDDLKKNRCSILI